MRLLLVEDDVMVGASIRLGLRQDEFVVDWVQDAAAAENALQSHCYSVVILDLALPRKHSLAVLEALYRRNDAVSVVFIDADRLSKAVDLEELGRRIRAAARRKVDRGERENTIYALPFSWR